MVKPAGDLKLVTDAFFFAFTTDQSDPLRALRIATMLDEVAAYDERYAALRAYAARLRAAVGDPDRVHAVLVELDTFEVRMSEAECPNGSKPPAELVRKYFECSTACLPHDEFERLDNEPENGILTAHVNHYGFEVWVRDENDMKHVRDNFPHLATIMDLARSLGCTWVSLDQDAEAIDGLPYFDW